MNEVGATAGVSQPETESEPRPIGEAAFEAFVRARTAALSRTAYLLTGDHHDAEDLLQTALFKAARSWSRIESNPEGYVRAILYRENVSRWRRLRSRPAEQLTAAPPERAGPVDDGSTRQALTRLTPKQRTMIVLRFFEDLSESQTAAVLGIGVGTVKSQTRRAIDRLAQLAPELAGLVGGD